MISRRRALQAMSAIMGAYSMGCGSAPQEEQNIDEGEEGLNVCLRGLDRNLERGGALQFHKYEKFVVLMMENRSFDHYFGHLSLPKSLGGEGRTDVDGFKNLDHSQPDLNGRPVKLWTPTNYDLGDIDHEWDACHGQFNGGQMDGFVRMHAVDLLKPQENRTCWGTKTADGQKKCGNLPDPMAYYKRKDTPIYHALFDNYAICDRYFCSVMGPTWPNRFYLHAATSKGKKKNSPITDARLDTLWDVLHEKCISAVNYYADAPWAAGAFQKTTQFWNFWNRKQGMARMFDNQPIAPIGGADGFLPEWARRAVGHQTFEQRAKEGTLPTVSILDPAFLAAPNDDHPPHDVQAGQTFVSMIYKLLTSNEEQWKKTLFLITYDEHGSFYDHVAPPSVREDENGEFQQLGFRVPTLVVGPYVKKNFVSHVQYDHSSVISTLTRRFNLRSINSRVDKAADFRDCIDFDALERKPDAPAIMPKTRVSESLAQESIYQSTGQKEVANLLLGGPVSQEQKKIYTDKFLSKADELGVAEIGK
jgi:phospholipase C